MFFPVRTTSWFGINSGEYQLVFCLPEFSNFHFMKTPSVLKRFVLDFCFTSLIRFWSSIQGRKARVKATRSSTAAQNRYSRGSPVSAHSSYSNSTSTNRLSNGTYNHTVEEYSNGTCEEPWIKHEWWQADFMT